MATVQEISRKTGVGLSTLRKLHKAGYLKAEKESEAALALVSFLARGNPLSVGQLAALLRDPTLSYDLGRYAEASRLQVAALGAVEATAAGREITAHLFDAADKQPAAVAVVADWMRNAIPAHPVKHAWLALRLVWNLPESLQAGGLERVSLAMLNARHSGRLAGYWEIRNEAGRPQTFYQKPKLSLDL
jgi:hypothetical protein